MKLPNFAADLDAKNTLDSDLHDLTNALAAARSFAEVIRYRIDAGTAKDAAIVDPLLTELDRVNTILQNVRRRTYRAGDVLECAKCGYSFVFRKASGKRATCARCRSTEVGRWKPAARDG